jgi:hypothetical protein
MWDVVAGVESPGWLPGLNGCVAPPGCLKGPALLQWGGAAQLERLNVMERLV